MHRQLQNPIPFRPPGGDRVRLYERAERTGEPVNRILARAVRNELDFQDWADRQDPCSLCHGSGWIPGVAKAEGPLDETPCPDCRVCTATPENR